MLGRSKEKRGFVHALLSWIGLLGALLGGCASRDSWIADVIGGLLGWGDTAWLPWGFFLLWIGLFAWDISDGVPDLWAIFGVLLIPSVNKALPQLAASGGNGAGFYVNWPFNKLNEFVVDPIADFFGGAGVTTVAGIAWFIVLGLCARLLIIRARGGKKAAGAGAGGAAAGRPQAFAGRR